MNCFFWKRSDAWRPSLWALLLAAGLGWWAGCARPDSHGEFDEIIVFADSTDWMEYRDHFKAIFARLMKTPVLEPEYVLSWKPFERFEQFKEFRNIFFIARLNSEQPVSSEVKQLLTPDMVKGIESGRYFYIPKKNVWANDQYVCFFVAPDREAMIQRIYDLGKLAYDDFERYYYDRLYRFMYRRYENDRLETYLQSHFPFRLRVQHDYFVADENVKRGYVWLRRLDPDRSFTVHWVPLSDSVQLSYPWVVKERNRLAGWIYEGDVVVEEETSYRPIRFLGMPALRVEGTWKNPHYVIGGPFRTVAFADSSSGLFYLLDYYVQAIGRRKKPFLDQLEVMLRTFRPRSFLEREKGATGKTEKGAE